MEAFKVAVYSQAYFNPLLKQGQKGTYRQAKMLTIFLEAGRIKGWVKVYRDLAGGGRGEWG